MFAASLPSSGSGPLAQALEQVAPAGGHAWPVTDGVGAVLGISETSLIVLGLCVVVPLTLLWLVVAYVIGAKHIPNDRVGVVEKLWSLSGSVSRGRIIASGGEAGYQSQVLRGGLHFRLWRWQFRIHKVPL